MLLFYHCSFCFGCADGVVWRYHGWVDFFAEGCALHASRTVVLPDATDQSLEVFTLGEGE
jgi:hypothetical protein